MARGCLLFLIGFDNNCKFSGRDRGFGAELQPPGCKLIAANQASSYTHLLCRGTHKLLHPSRSVSDRGETTRVQSRRQQDFTVKKALELFVIHFSTSFPLSGPLVSLVSCVRAE